MNFWYDHFRIGLPSIAKELGKIILPKQKEDQP